MSSSTLLSIDFVYMDLNEEFDNTFSHSFTALLYELMSIRTKCRSLLLYVVLEGRTLPPQLSFHPIRLDPNLPSE